MNRIRVLNVGRAPRDYACFVAACGGEERCTFLASRVSERAAKRFVWNYTQDKTEQARTNQARFAAWGFEFSESATTDPRSFVRGILAEAELRQTRCICIDISSLTKELMATWVWEIANFKFSSPIGVDFLYSHARFSPPPKSMGLAKAPSAVLPEFAGYFDDPGAPVTLIMGLGYEPHLALSFLEYLAPNRQIIFEPGHHDRRYTNAINEQNETFIKLTGNSPRIRYDVYKPYILFQELESAISGAQLTSRVHVAPYGLKLFVISSLLVALLHYPNVFVWHLKPDQHHELPNRISSGRTSGLHVQVNSIAW